MEISGIGIRSNRGGVEQGGQEKDHWNKEAGRGELLGRGVSVILLHGNFIPEADVRVYLCLFSSPSACTCCEFTSLYHYLTWGYDSTLICSYSIVQGHFKNTSSWHTKVFIRWLMHTYPISSSAYYVYSISTKASCLTFSYFCVFDSAVPAAWNLSFLHLVNFIYCPNFILNGTSFTVFLFSKKCFSISSLIP